MSVRDMQRRLKELASALKAEPGSIPRRLELAAALREARRPADAIDLYRGVAAVYAEEGRLVQAMAVCKGILEMDPEHRDTLEMLATLAQRRQVRRGAAELKQVDGRWVATPEASLATLSPSDALTPPSVRVPAGEPDGAAPADVRHAMMGVTPPYGTALSAPPGVEPETVLDFPEETKRRARGESLLALGGEPRDTLPSMPAVTDEPLGDAAEPTRAGTVETAEPTRAATPGALEAGHPPSVQSFSASSAEELVSLADDDEQAAKTIIQDALTAPFPRPALLVEPPPFPLLSDLPRGAFMELLARLSVVRLAGGAMVVEEGEVGDASYLVAAGSVRVTKAGVEVAVLGPGSFFGEFAVLADQRRHASVQTIEPVELLEISRALLDELVAAHPGVARTLRRFYRERLLLTLVATAPFFAQISAPERAQVSERFRPRRFGRGARIVEEGAPGGGLFLILVGEVQVVRGADSGEVELGTLGEGSYFGEMSLLRGGVASATVRATRLTEVVQLPPRDFYEVVSQHPVLWDQLRSEAERREMANHAILAGEARKSEDGTIYLV